MIIALLDDALAQIGDRPRLTEALRFLAANRGRELPEGRMDVGGDSVFALVQTYDPKPVPPDGPTFEAHRAYIDVQYLSAGTEIMGWGPLSDMQVTAPYDSEKDALFGTVPSELWTPVTFNPNQVIILFPEDAHAPGLPPPCPGPVHKIVVKVAVT